jgi:hypothetical protein
MMQIRWWLIFALIGVLLAVVALTVLGGNAQFLVFCLGVLFVVFSLFRRAGGQDYHREPPVPPGAPGTTS